MPYISVIVTAYRRRQYLYNALLSVKAQTLPRNKYEVMEGARLSQLSSRYGPWVQEALTSMGYSLSWVGLTDAIVRRRAQP